MTAFIKEFGKEVSPKKYELQTKDKALITAIFSAGTFCGALGAGYLCDRLGRRVNILGGVVVYSVGVVLQVAANFVGLLVAGRAVAGLGVGIMNSAVVLYESEITSRSVRSKVLLCYQ